MISLLHQTMVTGGWILLYSVLAIIVYMVLYFVITDVSKVRIQSGGITAEQVDQINVILNARRILYADMIQLCNEKFRKRYGIKEEIGSLLDMTNEEAQKFIDSYKGTLFSHQKKA